MLRLTTLLRSFGNAGAVANVREVLEARAAEDGEVDALLARLDRNLLDPAVPSAA